MKIEIYGKPGCGYCVRAKKVCEAYEWDYTYIDIAADPSQKPLLESKMDGVPLRTVPQIFVNDVLIQGGYTGFAAYVKEIE